MNRFNHTIFNMMPVIGIMRNHTFEELVNLLPIFLDSGFTTLEITMNSPGAAEMITYAADTYGHLMNIGAGTVCNIKDLDIALKAGAKFIVMPIVEESVILACVKEKIPVFPGAMTPTEIAKAWSLGATMVKLFPASTLGAPYVKEVLAPLSHVQLLATGGITADNLEAFFSAGIKGFGIGSPLFVRSIIAKKDWKALAAHFKSFAAKVKAFNPVKV